MKRTFLTMTVSIPVTYDDSCMSEETAIDVADKMAREALVRTFEGRHFDTDGRYQDCDGPTLVPAPSPSEKPISQPQTGGEKP